MIPIWKDTYYTTSADSLNYELRIGGSVIFSGRAYKAPDKEQLKIKLNGIVSNYLFQELPISETDLAINGYESENYEYDMSGKCAVTVALYNTDTNSSLANYPFYYDYSYTPEEDEGVVSLSWPINRHYNRWMFGLSTDADFDASTVYNTVITRSDEDFEESTEYCGDYALYYVNRFGGWDTFLIEGKVKESDSFEIAKYKKVGDNTEFLNSETTRFNNSITHTYELNTGWLTDEQSKRLASQLLPSNLVYLHNLKTNKIIPVTITDSSVDYKEFLNERKLISYQINVEESVIKSIK